MGGVCLIRVYLLPTLLPTFSAARRSLGGAILVSRPDVPKFHLQICELIRQFRDITVTRPETEWVGSLRSGEAPGVCVLSLLCSLGENCSGFIRLRERMRV